MQDLVAISLQKLLLRYLKQSKIAFIELISILKYSFFHCLSAYFMCVCWMMETQLAAVAALCVQYEADFRPNMSIVVKALQPLLNARAAAPGDGLH